jgi:hypothetical protein
MPCYDGGGAWPDYGPELRACHERLDNVTRLLCWTVGWLRSNGQLHVVQAMKDQNRELGRWIYQHDKDDAERQERELAQAKKETIRQRALSKLTKEERRELGL